MYYDCTLGGNEKMIENKNVKKLAWVAVGTCDNGPFDDCCFKSGKQSGKP